MPRVVVFVGPQGSGKSTLAYIFNKLFKVKVVKAIFYTIFHIWGIKIINFLGAISGKTVVVKFYEDDAPRLSASPELYRRLMRFFVLLHILGLVIDHIAILLRSWKAGNKIVIEDEGFIYKQLADLLYLAKFVGFPMGHPLIKFFVSLALMILKHVDKAVLFMVHDYNILRSRYLKQKAYTGWRKVEPVDYVLFQIAVYKAVGVGCVVDASGDLKRVFEDVRICLKSL